MDGDTVTVELGNRAEATQGERLAGACGLVFVTTVALQNLLRASAPADDAKVGDVIRHFADHRRVEQSLFVLFVIGLFALAVFAAATYREVVGRARGPWAVVGLVGVTGIVALYSLLVVSELALAVLVDRHAAPATIETMWVVHNAGFTLLLPMIGVALLGFALASAQTGLVSRRFRVVGPAGALLLAVTALPAMATTEGSKILAVGLVGFVIWLVWVASAGVTMLRRR